jgi:N-methylhydantoinase B
MREGSGGTGQWRGGAGVVREFEALTPLEVTVLSERRRHGPSGTAGGAAGLTGANSLNGREIPSKCTKRLAEGDILRIETPGGGGWGKGALE